MASYYPYILQKRAVRNGTTPLYVCYNYNRVKRTLIPTGYNISLDNWNSEQRCVKENSPQYEKINSSLFETSSILEEILQYAKQNSIDPTVDFVLSELNKRKKEKLDFDGINLFEALELYIEEKKGKVSNNQITEFKTLRKHLKSFERYSSQEIKFSNLNLKFYNEFLDYLFYKAVKPDGRVGLLTNSAGKVIRLLKGFVNYQVAEGRVPAIDLKAFKFVEEETNTIAVSEEEIEKIYNLDLSKDIELEEIKDLFVLGCCTGLRYSDLLELSEDNINKTNGLISISRRKIHRAIVIPMIDYAPSILSKYNYNLPKVELPRFNELIKEVGRRADLSQKVELVYKRGNNTSTTTREKWELLSSNTCRRSFCTNMYLAGFPPEMLIKISGHKSVPAFMRFIKIDNTQAAMRLKEIRKKTTLK